MHCPKATIAFATPVSRQFQGRPKYSWQKFLSQTSLILILGGRNRSGVAGHRGEFGLLD